MQTEAAVPNATPNYAANPSALADMTDEQLDALAFPNADTASAASTATATQGDTSSSASPDAAGQTTEAATATEPVTGTEAPAVKGVQAKDGDHVIPYSVLERERDRALRAEATASALAEELSRVKAGGTPSAEAASQAVQLSEEDLAQLDNDLPSVAKVIRAQMQQIEALNGTVKTIKQGHEVQQKSAEQARMDEENAAIAANPTLVSLQAGMAANDPKATARWNRVVDTYQTMLSDPEFIGLDTAALINKATTTVAAMYGDLPAAPAATDATASQATPEALKAKADAALANATQSGASAPRSLGDIPGGYAPAVDESAALLAMSGPEATAAFMNMTPEQIEAKLNRLR